MYFIDSINLYLSSGNGGNGCVSFLNSIHTSCKKPDGGNGGVGGNVYFLGDKKIKNFKIFNYKFNYKAGDGHAGQSNCKTGKNGCDLIIRVPLGTVLYDGEKNLFLFEILNDKDKILVLEGGRGGYGNFFLKSCDKLIFQKLVIGGKSKVSYFKLELKLLSDVGLLGYPNVGKSLFINRVSDATSKVADYSFTTLSPILGMLKLNYFDSIIISDLPGLIKNSCFGFGLGFNFLKHLLKTRLLLHIVDASSFSSSFSFFKELIIINNELFNYNFTLSKVNKWLIFNKIDLVKNFNSFILSKELLLKLGYTNIFFISSKNKIGLKKLCFNIVEFFSLF